MESKTERRVGVRRTWFVLIAVLILLAAVAVWKSAKTAGSMTAAMASGDEKFEDAKPGTKVKVVIEIGETTGEGKIRGTLLQKKTEEIYTRTATPVNAQSNAETKVVMGKQEDIHKGAVMHVTGTVRDDHSIAAEQIVILTGYVKVQ